MKAMPARSGAGTPAGDGAAPGGLGVCSAMLASWFAASMLAMLIPHSAIAPILGLLAQLLLLGFALTHSALFTGWRRTGVLVLTTALVSFGCEASSIATGFPDGFFTHNVALPKLLGVPVIIPIVYFSGAWPAWTLARLIGQSSPLQTTGRSRFITPIIAAFIATGTDLPIDPIESTVNDVWTWHHPGGFIGVPLTNFFGLLLTFWAICQIFALVERAQWRRVVAARGYWMLPCLQWLGTALAYPVLFLMAPGGSVTRGGLTVPVPDVYAAGIVSSLFGIVAIALIGLSRLASCDRTGPAFVPMPPDHPA